MLSAHELNPEFDGIDNETFGYVDFTLHQTGDDCLISVAKHDAVIGQTVVRGSKEGFDGGHCYGVAKHFATAALQATSARRVNEQDYTGRLQHSSGDPYGNDYSSTYRYRFAWA